LFFLFSKETFFVNLLLSKKGREELRGRKTDLTLFLREKNKKLRSRSLPDAEPPVYG
jgi:hypothetical protein